MSASGRPTRSRVSSPMAPAPLIEDADVAADKSEKPRTMMQNWVAGAATSSVSVHGARGLPKSSWTEPALAAPRASFQEAGHFRHSIVQNMMPLGVGPPAKVLKALAKGDSERAKSLVNSVVSTPEPAQETATPEEAPEGAPEEAEVPEESVDSAPLAEEERVPSAEIVNPVASVEADDAEPPPQQASPSSPPPPSDKPENTDEHMESLSRVSDGPHRAWVDALSSPNAASQERVEQPDEAHATRYPRYLSETPEPALGPDGLAITNLALTDRVIEVAVQEALDDKRWPTAYALRLLWDEHRTDPDMVRMFDAVYYGWHTKEQVTKFQKMMREKKKEGRKDGCANEYFNGDGADSKSSEQPPIYNEVDAVNPPAPIYQTPYASASRQPSADASELPFSPNGMQANLSPATRAPASVATSPQPEDAHIKKKHRSNSFQPATAEMNGFLGTNGMNGASGSEKSRRTQEAPGTHSNGEGQQHSRTDESANAVLENGAARAPKATTHAPQRSRSPSNSSSSALSSIDEKVFNENNSVSPPLHLRPHHGATLQGAPPHAANFHGAPPHGAPPHGAPPPRAPPQQLPLPLPRFAGAFAQLFQPPKQRVSPYASSVSFQEAALEAEAQARNATRPMNVPAKAGPKLHTFFTGNKSSPVPAPARASSADSQSTIVTPPEPAEPAEPVEPAPMSPALLPAPAAAKPAKSAVKKLPPTFKIKPADKTTGASYHEDENTARLKRKARELTAKTSTVESFERHQLSSLPNEDVPWASDGGDSVTVKTTKKPKKGPKLRILNKGRETRQNSRYASDEGSSPTELAFKPPYPPGGSAPSSRAGTPNAANRHSRKPKTGSGLRLKSSPLKKNKGTSAGIPKDMRSPTGNGGTAPQDGENDDFCSACGGGGDLVCCDGCVRSFHSKCIDPPMSDDIVYQSEDWFCNVCEGKKHGPLEDAGGIWGRLIADFADTNPRSFHLPQSIREYFVDVKTGAEGEYEEVVPPKPKAGKATWEEAPDYFKKRDKTGKIILCHQCNGEASAPDRMIIPCTYCSLSWHLDCLPNPLAKEPGHGRQWRCPAHVDDLLTLIPEIMAPAHRFRKIKGASVIKPAFPRGTRNNGHIEIENDPSEDEEVEGFYDLKEFGRVYKLPEKSIKLDFISRVKQTRAQDLQSLRTARPQAANAPQPSLQSAPAADRQTWNQRTVEEQQAALNLASIYTQSNDRASGDSSQMLISALLAEAPPGLISMVAQGTPSGLAGHKLEKNELTSMKAMFEFLKHKLAIAESSDDGDIVPNAISSPPNSIPEGSSKNAAVQGEDTDMLT